MVFAYGVKKSAGLWVRVAGKNTKIYPLFTRNPNPEPATNPFSFNSPINVS